jgi:6,7-dimethyl-8-ribityllumazine synthase
LTSDETTRLEPSDLEALEARGVRSLQGEPAHAADEVSPIWVLCAKFNGSISARLCHGALDAFLAHGVDPETIRLAWVPGAFELPLAAKRSATDGGACAVVCLGAVIRGDTPHFDFVAGECAAGLRQVGISTGVPVVFGVLTTENIDQAIERSNPGESNKGYEAAITALEMIDLLPRIRSSAPSAGSASFRTSAAG